MAVNDTSELLVIGNLAVGSTSQTYVHTLHFRHLTVPAGTSPEAVLINRWQATSHAAWQAMHTNIYNQQEVIARQVCGSVPLRAPSSEAAVFAGSRVAPGGDPLPQWLAAVVTERTDLAGRSRRGRFFVSGLYEADIIGNNIDSGIQGLINAYCTTLMDAYGPTGTDADFRLVVHSRKLASVPGTQCQDASRIVTQLLSRLQLTTQRSRKPRVFA